MTEYYIVCGLASLIWLLMVVTALVILVARSNKQVALLTQIRNLSAQQVGMLETSLRGEETP